MLEKLTQMVRGSECVSGFCVNDDGCLEPREVHGVVAFAGCPFVRGIARVIGRCCRLLSYDFDTLVVRERVDVSSSKSCKETWHQN